MSDKPIDRAAQATPKRVARKIRGLSDRAIAWIFVAPTIFLLLAINIFPLIWTINLSFTNFKANSPNREVKNVGLRNYERILTDTLRQFFTITIPMVLPFLMLAVLFRGIENFKMFDLVVQLTGGGPGSTTELTSINLKREAFEKWRTGYASAYAIILFVTVFGLASIYVKALNKVKER